MDSIVPGAPLDDVEQRTHGKESRTRFRAGIVGSGLIRVPCQFRDKISARDQSLEVRRDFRGKEGRVSGEWRPLRMEVESKVGLGAGARSCGYDDVPVIEGYDVEEVVESDV